jgi:hypothetical protein
MSLVYQHLWRVIMSKEKAGYRDMALIAGWLIIKVWLQSTKSYSNKSN